MVKGFKGLKRLGAFVLSLVMAASMAVTVAPGMKAQAAGYEKIQEKDFSSENAEWRFADGINNPGNTTKDKSVFSVKKYETTTIGSKNGLKYVLVLENGYKWKANGEEKSYDLWIDIVFVPENDNALNGRNGTMDDFSQTYLGYAGGNNILSFLPNPGGAYTLDVYFWLCNKGTETIVNDVPFIVGPVWNGSGEYLELWSNDKTVYTNLTGEAIKYKKNTDASYPAWEGVGTNDDNLNKPDRYMVGVGRDGSGKAHFIYHNKASGPLELRLGYQAYRISYVGDGGIKNDSLIGLTEDRPASGDNVNYYHPTKSTGSIEAVDGNSIKKFTIDRLYTGENSANSNTEKDVPAGTKVTFKGKDGTIKTLGVNDEILEEDIPYFNMMYNTEILVTSVPTAQKVVLNYFYKNSAIGEDGTAPNTKSIYASGEMTSNHSYAPGTIVPGKDGKNYKLVGWFDKDGNEYKFGDPISADTDIYAKWEEVVEDSKPSSTPEDSSSDTDTPSTGETIKVEFVTPIGNPPPTQIKHVGDKADDPGAPIDPATLKPGTIIDGHRFEGWYLDKGFTMPYNFDTKLPHSIVLYAKWVRVSPKTGDTTIPAVYYVFGALALAGVGALATKSRKLRK